MSASFHRSMGTYTTGSGVLLIISFILSRTSAVVDQDSEGYILSSIWLEFLLPEGTLGTVWYG